MGLQDEYAIIAQGMRAGTLKQKAPEEPPELWISKRFSGTADDSVNSFCEQYDSRKETSQAFSFGLCTLDVSKKVSVSREMAHSCVGTISPGPLAYSLRGTFGPKSAQHSEASAHHARSTLFGTELRHSQEVREAKARGQPVEAELEHIRTHSNVNFFKSGRAPTTMGTASQ